MQKHSCLNYVKLNVELNVKLNVKSIKNFKQFFISKGAVYLDGFTTTQSAL